MTHAVRKIGEIQTCVVAATIGEIQTCVVEATTWRATEIGIVASRVTTLRSHRNVCIVAAAVVVTTVKRRYLATFCPDQIFGERRGWQLTRVDS